MLIECIQQVAVETVSELAGLLVDGRMTNVLASFAALFSLLLAIQSAGFGGKAGSLLIRLIVLLATVLALFYLVHSRESVLIQKKEEILKCLGKFIRPGPPTPFL